MVKEIREFLLKFLVSKMLHKIRNNVFQFSFQEFGSCVYFLKIKNKNLLIDTSTKENREELIKDLKKLNLKPRGVDIVLLTHKHYDHTGNLDLFKNAEIYEGKNIDKFQIKEIKTIKTPGHSKDSICFLYQDILFSGDTIFYNGGRGRTDLPGGSEPAILRSIKKLKGVKYKILCPGHV